MIVFDKLQHENQKFNNWKKFLVNVALQFSSATLIFPVQGQALKDVEKRLLFFHYLFPYLHGNGEGQGGDVSG